MILAVEGEELFYLGPGSDLKDIEAYQDKICKWSDGIQERLYGIYEDSSVALTHCPPIERLELMRHDAVDMLKAQVSKIVAGARELLSRWDYPDAFRRSH